MAGSHPPLRMVRVYVREGGPFTSTDFIMCKTCARLERVEPERGKTSFPICQGKDQPLLEIR